jgi:hypothetical protein
MNNGVKHTGRLRHNLAAICTLNNFTLHLTGEKYKLQQKLGTIVSSLVRRLLMRCNIKL